MSAESAKSRFDRALVELQVVLKIVPTGVAEEGAWNYAFTCELLQCWFPGIPARAAPSHLVALVRAGFKFSNGEAEMLQVATSEDRLFTETPRHTPPLRCDPQLGLRSLAYSFTREVPSI